MKRTIKTIGAFALVATLTLAIYASVTFDPVTGFGFVGKGDVQLVKGWNNKQLQDGAAFLQFSASTIAERSWECTRINAQNGNETVQERQRTTTRSGLLFSTARERNQITGFFLEGYSGSVATSTDGPAVDSCPANPSGFFLSSPAGDPVIVGGGVSVDNLPLQ